LAEAGIEIPFPQRDLHLRSVDPRVGDALGLEGGKNEPPA
jgi:small-conductance mechanosensitive channel